MCRGESGDLHRIMIELMEILLFSDLPALF